MSDDLERLIREVQVDGLLLTCLQRGRKKKKTNLWVEMKRSGCSDEEICQAAMREINRQTMELNRQTKILFAEAEAAGLL